MVLLREGHVHFHIVAGLLSDELLLKGIDEGMGADGKGIVLTLSAFKRFAVRKAFIVDHGNVAVFYGTVHGDHSGVVLSLLVQIRVNLFVGNRHIRLRYFHALISAQGNRRLQRHFSRENEGLSGLNLLHIDLRGGHDGLFALLQRLLIGLRDQGIRRVLVEKSFSVHLLDHPARNLSLTEAGNLDLSLILLICLLNRCLKILCGNFNGENRHILFLFFHL